MTLCSDVVGYQCFIHPLPEAFQRAMLCQSLPWRWRQHDLKCWYPTTSLHSVITQKTTTWICRTYTLIITDLGVVQSFHWYRYLPFNNTVVYRTHNSKEGPRMSILMFKKKLKEVASPVDQQHYILSVFHWIVLWTYIFQFIHQKLLYLIF